jgi:hypothetical protein
MKKSTNGVLATLAVAIAHAALVPKTLSENIAPHIETIPIQTLTISDEQFLTGDASGRPTTISRILKVAQGSGHFPLVILVRLIHLLDAGSSAPLLINHSPDSRTEATTFAAFA